MTLLDFLLNMWAAFVINSFRYNSRKSNCQVNRLTIGSLSIYHVMPVCLCVILNAIYPFLIISVCRSMRCYLVCFPAVCILLCLPTYLTVCLSVCVSVCLCVCLSIYWSIG